MTSKHAEFEREYMIWRYKLGEETSGWKKKIAAEVLTQGSYQQGVDWINKLEPRINDSFPGGALGTEINYLRKVVEDARQDVMKQALSQEPKE